MNPRLRWLLAVAVCTLFLLVLLRPDHLNLGSLAVQPPPSGTKSRTTDERPDPVCPQGDKPKEPILRTWDPSLVLKGLPTSRGMDNLRDDKFYITSWAVAGFTNQFISYVNLIYLGILSGRTPIIPPFVPSHHLPPGAEAFPFGQVFNVSALRDTLRHPIIEWGDVKELSTSVLRPPEELLEQVGCWSTRKPSGDNPTRAPPIVNNLRLDPSYTRLPRSTRLNSSDLEGDFVVLNEIVPFIFPDSPHPHHQQLMSPSADGQRLPPNSRLACFDLLYFASTSHRQFEWEHEWSPMWRLVGKYAQFTDELLSITRKYLASTFSTDTNRIPPFIAVHMRRADFGESCKGQTNCFVPLTAFVKQIIETKKEAQARFGYRIDRVLLFSDDETLEFWGQAKALGWHYFDHKREKTVEKYGHWYPTIIDVAAQSMAHGFVGTSKSTLSLLSVRRVNDWQRGPTALVRKGE